MSRGQALTLGLLGLAGGLWWLAGWLLDKIGLADFALPLSAAALVLALTGAEAGLTRFRPRDDLH
jgi:hypothetical protein